MLLLLFFKAIDNMLVFDSLDPLYEDTMEAISTAKAGDTVYVFLKPTHRIIEYAPQHNIEIPADEQVPSSIATPIIDGNVCVVLADKGGKAKSPITVFVGEKILPNWIPKTSVVDLMFACTYDKAQGIFCI